MANRNFSNSRIYTGHVMPVLLDCNFVVAPAATSGLGISALKGPYVQNVFMNTSATPGAGNSNSQTPGIIVTNPNPAAGTIVIQLNDNYSKSYIEGFSIASPLGTPSTATVTGIASTITALGTATLAQWRAVGLPAGITPAVGVSFIASATATIGGSATAAPTAAAGSGVASIELVGNPQLSLSPNPSSRQGFGAQLILQCRDYAGALVAPAVGSTISISMLLSNSSILVAGE